MSNIIFKKHTCKNRYGESHKLEDNTISLYVVTTRKCNANCKFCEYTHGESELDAELFDETFNKLLNICSINTVHFTGGEPTIELDKIKRILKIIKQHSRLTTTSINTNGFKLRELENIKELDNISLSRHAIQDKDNYNIFGNKEVASTKDISEFQEKYKLHLSCNLIKGYVDTNEKIIDYLEYASKLDINDTGFVSLMQVNEYCKENYIAFIDDLCKITDRITKSRFFENEVQGQTVCKCENYLYRAQNNRLVSAYHRYAIQNTEIADYLVYESNTLKQGFNGNIITI